MSWLFSKAMMKAYENSHSSLVPAGESSEATYSDGEPYAQLNVMPTPHKFWRNDKTMDASDLSRFGLTLRLLTDDHGQAVLTSYLEDFPARTLAQQEKAKDLQENVQDYGEKWFASLARFDPVTCSLKTVQCSLIEDLTGCLPILPRWGLMLNGECLERTNPELPIIENESGLLPTPTASNTKAHQIRGADKGKVREPRSYGAIGPLNPLFLEWLMGWPMGWTGLDQLEMDKFREWLQQHGGFLADETEK